MLVVAAPNMEPTTNKNRTPSRCREWERNRRNKFNNAISRLGDVVKQLNKALDSTNIEDENTQYPKIEIVEKAIECLTNCVQEKTKLKAEILALQVKLETENKKKVVDKKDASTQVFIGTKRKKQDGQYGKLLMFQKSKHKALKKKTILTTNVKVTKPSVKISTHSIASQNLPLILPKSTLNDKKGHENTIVVLPATPYIFPQRPLLFPTGPPAFVLVDSNLQTLNKPTFPLVNRTSGDSTKTTMVNILPISAYSRPLSANKTKKNNVKPKTDVAKKTTKKSKQTIKVVKQPSNDSSKTKPCEIANGEDELKQSNNDKEELQIIEKAVILKKPDVTSNKASEPGSLNNKERVVEEDNSLHLENNSILIKTKDNVSDVMKQHNCTEVPFEKSNDFSNVVTSVNKDNNNVVQSTNLSDKPTKVPEKEPISEEKDKENKLPNILDTTLCENTVDGGNARSLELAEEFLAASPTAAFLMSFPLVSGNRADSPAEEPHTTIQVPSKENSQRRNDMSAPSHPVHYFDKPSDNKVKTTNKSQNLSTNIMVKQNEQPKYVDNVLNKQPDVKTTNIPTTTNVSSENPFLNLPMPSLISTNGTLSESTYSLDFDCNISKPMPTQPTSYTSNSNLFYKSDPFSTVKSTIYSTSSISSGHEFNSFGLYPCAMEKYSSKNKSDYSNVEDNLMKIGSSRLTYDIDLGWSHKGFDFPSCASTTNSFNKDNILTTNAGPYSTSYNPFNPEFHVPLPSNSNKKESSVSKSNSSFTDTITSFYSQPSNLWSDDIYTNNSVSKSFTVKHQNYLPLDHNMQTNLKSHLPKQYETKHISETSVDNVLKSSNIGLGQEIPEKFTKKSPSKMHINWMTSEIRPMQSNCNAEIKETHKSTYGQLEHLSKKQDHNETNYFPISMHHNFPQATPEELQVWPSTRAGGTTEISIEPPPINLPTLVGDLALGPHDKKKNTDITNRGVTQPDIQNCSNFFSVTQLMNRSTDNNVQSRYEGSSTDATKSNSSKQSSHATSDTNRKTMSRLENHLPQPCYVFNEPKTTHSYENVGHFSHSKTKASKSDKSSKAQKNSYSAEALIRGGTCTQKIQDINSTKFMVPSQKYNDFNAPTDSSVAQVSHFPPILDYSDNSYTGQQFSGTTLYNSTTNTISNSFYTNFIPGSSNLMSSNYASGPFSGDFIDYNQGTECNYTTHKYEDLKMRNNPTMFQQDKVPSNYKTSRRESAAKHKLECSKKESSKKYQNKRVKLNSEIEEWPDSSHLLWQNKNPTKRQTNLMSEELPFPNYVSNQVPGQYQPDFFNSHLMPSNVQSVGHNIDRSLANFPVTSRANFNLSTIFPEITMKVQ